MGDKPQLCYNRIRVINNRVIMRLLCFSKIDICTEFVSRVCWHMGLEHERWRLKNCIVWRGGAYDGEMDVWSDDRKWSEYLYHFFGFSECGWGGEAWQIEMVWASGAWECIDDWVQVSLLNCGSGRVDVYCVGTEKLGEKWICEYTATSLEHACL